MIVVGKKKRGCGCGCVQVGGRGMAGMGDLTPERLASAFQAASNKAAAEFSAPMTWAQEYKKLVPHLERVDQFVKNARTMKTLRADQVSSIEKAAAELRSLRNVAKVNYANTPNASANNLAAVRAAVLAPLQWLGGVTGQALAQSNARAATVKAAANRVKNAPGDLLDWGRDQLQTGLGIPRWAIPVGLGVAGLLIALPYVRPLLARKAAI